ncbi:MAG TPA: methyltransferase domain-containing protein [Tepidisphaeraceae bacterium]|nr:methyltransferase domain-containing protein [Tepidisphaeraceae bacterium]
MLQDPLPPQRSTQPVSRLFGTDRGTPIDRYYIEGFLQANQQSIRGRVMEVGDPTYTRQFGGDRVTQSDVLHAVPGNRKATFVGNLETGAGIPAGAFDCIVLTQVLPFLYDVRGAVRSAYAALAPGGTVLATMAGISQISRYDMDRWGDFWRFTSLSARRLFEEAFRPGDLAVETFGNVLIANAFLQGMALHEVTRQELDFRDADYEVIVTVRATKASP